MPEMMTARGRSKHSIVIAEELEFFIQKQLAAALECTQAPPI